MAISGIEAAIDRTVEKLSADHRVQDDVKAAFLALLDQLRGIAASDSARGSSGAGGGNATMPLTGASPLADLSAAAHAPRVNGYTLLKDSNLEPLATLPATADATHYNAREAMLRERLNLGELERRLRSGAEAQGIDYGGDDLAGVLRNAGYDGVHLGSSERYMAAIERMTTETIANYSVRANNVPGQA